MKKIQFAFFTLLFFIATLTFAQHSIYEPADIDTIKYSLDDFGTMWTFDDIPLKRLAEKYNFTPDEDWLENVQKSALQFGGGCSAAFVSEDGLIMTNHHCGRGQLHTIQKEGEDLLRDGFYAETLDDERQVPGTYVDQLIVIYDVTDRIKEAASEGKTDKEKVELKQKEINDIEKEFSEETDLVCKVVTLYHGGKYSLYCYRRYDDIRLVMAPDFQIAATGWDWDNFTYPRYELDFAFYRAYENDKPIETERFFKFSKNGAEEGDPVFIIGRPGSTDRLLSFAELEYLRDYAYRQRLLLFNEMYKIYYDEYLNRKPEENESEMLNRVMGYGNARKSYAGRLVGLKDPIILKKKADFENHFKELVRNNPELNEKYGSVWDDIKSLIDEKKTISNELTAYSLYRRFPSAQFGAAQVLIEYAEGNGETDKEKVAENLEQIYSKSFGKKKTLKYLTAFANVLNGLIPDDPVIKKIFGEKKGEAAAEFMIENSSLLNKEDALKTLDKPADEILSSNDPFIYFIQNTKELYKKYAKQAGEIENTLAVKNELLGEAVFEVFGDKIPPDASLTLRFSDGVIKGYEYNGTIAPGKTTFYGLYDRYFSFGGATYPWGLHERWKTPPPELDLSTSIGFAATNDIVGGNSGSSIINTNAEVVGLVHDGNMESLPGHIIYLEENNRSVATDSKGLIEALKYVYKTDRLVKELEAGKIVK